MRVLVIGSGGREHALCWKIAGSEKVGKVYCAPGNSGMEDVAELVPLSASNISGLADFAEKEKISLTVVGPELSLVAGIVDEFDRRGLPVFGPNKRAAQLEGSKVFMKKFLSKYGIATANYAVFKEAAAAKDYIRDVDFPLVIKADGLAAGKGVVICKSQADAESAIDAMLKKKEYGDAGSMILVEDFLKGEEVSFIAMSDGEHILPLATSQDHKAVYDGDQGPNTGGMGAYSPAPIVSRELSDKIVNEIMLPTVRGMKKEGRPFVGFLYAGLMISDNKPYVLEYNVRCGDPETQPLMMRLKSDIVMLFEAALEGTLDSVNVEWDARPSVCVVMASRGYPGNYEKGEKIFGLETVSSAEDVKIFYAGAKKINGEWVTSGGRVLGVTAIGETIKAAMSNAYAVVDKIRWDGAHYRKDIGQKALRYETLGQLDLC